MTPEEREIFEGISNGMTFGSAPENVSPYEEETNAYGTAVHKKKAGLTRRGKVAIAVAGVAIVGGGTIWWNAHSAQVAKDEKEAAALQIQMKKLELEEMRIRNEKAAGEKKAATAAQTALQAKVDQCVKDASDQIGKGYGAPSKGDVISDCRQQYEAAEDGSDIAPAGNAEDAGGGSGGGLNSGATLGIIAGLGLGVAIFAKKGQKATTS